MLFRLRLQHFIALFLVVITITTFIKVTGYDFLNLDDDIHVYDNRYVLQPTGSNLKRFWQAPYQQLYIPMTYSLWWLQAKLSQNQAADDARPSVDPHVYHTVNLLIHVFSVLVVFMLLGRLVHNEWAAGFGALVFGLYPVQVEAIAWISETKGLLSGGFSLFAIWQYTIYAASGARKPNIRYLIASICFALALLSKPSAITVPIMTGIIAIWLLRRPVLRTTGEMVPWLIMSLPLIVMTKMVQPDAAQQFLPSLWQRFLVAGDALSFYVYKLALPVSLGLDYGRTPEYVLKHWWSYVTGIVPYLLLALLLWRCRRAWVLVPVFVSVAALLPILGLVTFDFQHVSTVADRYLYLAMLGPALGAAGLFARWEGWMLRGVSVAVVAGLVFLSVQQVYHWRSSESLFRETLRVNNNSWLANNSLGLMLRREGKMHEAVAHYKEAIRIRPDYAKAHMNLGVILVKMNRAGEALGHIQESLRLNPKSAKAHINLGIALVATGKLDLAVPYFREAVRLQPDYADAHYNLANALYMQGDFTGAMEEFRASLEIDPGLQQARRALQLLQQGGEQ